MIIDQLPSLSPVLPTDEIPVERGTTAYKATVQDINGAVKKCLYLTSVAISATTGNIAVVSNANITADFVLAEITWANPSAITTDVTWATASGSLTLNGTCTTATTASIVLIKKDN